MLVENLPKKIAIFPLSGVVFFPKTILPLNIFEERYIELVNDCMKNKKLFGMVQPKFKTNLKPELYNVGCLGKITNFNKTNDGRFIINLSGIIRFRINEELKTNKLYREFKVNYSDFITDLDNKKEKECKNQNLIDKIKIFLSKKNYTIESNQLEKINSDQLINTICMVYPFSILEKQKLIETINVEDKIKVLEEIINFDLADHLKNETIQ